MADSARTRNRLLGVIATLLMIAGLRWSYPVSMPLAAAIFVVAAIWPMKPWLDQRLPAGLSTLLTVLALLLVLLGFCGAVYLSALQVVQNLLERQAEFQSLYDGFIAFSHRHGLPVPLEHDGAAQVAALAQSVLAQLYSVFGYLGIIAVLVLLGLPEVGAFRRKLGSTLTAPEQQRALDAVARIAAVFRSYVGGLILVSLLTGLASSAWAFTLGLDLAVTWGVLNFLLNFIPIFGNVLGIIPPTLYALVQFQDWQMPLVTFLGYAVLQAVISNLVYPWLQGGRLSLSPAAVVLALAFWGWLWGVAGALLAVPLTAAVAIVCGRFAGTAWIARLLSKA